MLDVRASRFLRVRACIFMCARVCLCGFVRACVFVNVQFFRWFKFYFLFQNVSIIVFPEYGITGRIPEDRNSALAWMEEVPNPMSASFSQEPCMKYKNKRTSRDLCLTCLAKSENRFVLKALQCLAQVYSITLVANMAEVEYCHSTATQNPPLTSQPVTMATSRHTAVRPGKGRSTNSDTRKNSVFDPDCPADGRFQFNTNVVFDSTGTLVVRYRKQHLYDEPQFDTPPKATPGVFDTAFGRFATFVCYDINFYYSSADVVFRHEVDSVAMTSFWSDALPTSSPVQTHSGWALGTEVNLLTSNVRLEGFTGSGLYSGIWRKFSYTYDVRASLPVLVTADLPCYKRAPLPWAAETASVTSAQKGVTSKAGGRSRRKKKKNRKKKGKKNGARKVGDSLQNPNCSSLSKSDSRATTDRRNRSCLATIPDFFQNDVIGVPFNFTALTHGAGAADVCQRDLCCHLDYVTSDVGNAEKELYALGVFNNNYSLAQDSFWWQVCALLKCKSPDYRSCGEPVRNATTVFKSLSLRGNFWAEFIIPSVLVHQEGANSGPRLAPLDQWSFVNHDEALFSTAGLTDSVLVAEIQSFEPDKHDQNKKGVDIDCSCS